jgi:hypothetical protein
MFIANESNSFFRLDTASAAIVPKLEARMTPPMDDEGNSFS